MKTLLMLMSLVALTALQARAETDVVIVSDTDAMNEITSNLGEPDAVADYKMTDPDTGHEKASGTVEIHADKTDKKDDDSDNVIVVRKDQDGNIQEVRKDKKTYVPSQFGEGYSWWDIGLGMYAGSLGSKVLNPPNVAPGRTNQNEGAGGLNPSFVIRPRILQQRLDFGVDLFVNGCSKNMNYPSSGDTTIISGLNCHQAVALSSEFAVFRTGHGDGHHQELSLGVTRMSFSVDHMDPELPNPVSSMTTTHENLILGTASYRFWTDSFIHPQVKAMVGPGTVVLSFSVRFSRKKKVIAIDESLNQNM